MPDPPLKMSRRQPSAVWRGAQQAPTRSTWQGWSATALLSIPRPFSQEVAPAPKTGQPMSLVQMGPSLQVDTIKSAKQEVLEGEWRKYSENWGLVGRHTCTHTHTPFVRLYQVPGLIIQGYRYILGARRPGRTGVDTGDSALSSLAPGSVMEHAAAGHTVHAERVLLHPGNIHFPLHRRSFVLNTWLIVLEELKAISVLREHLQHLSYKKFSCFLKQTQSHQVYILSNGEEAESVFRGLWSTANTMENPFPCHSSLDSAIIPFYLGACDTDLDLKTIFQIHLSKEDKIRWQEGGHWKIEGDAKGLLRTPKTVMRLRSGFKVLTSLLLPVEQ